MRRVALVAAAAATVAAGLAACGSEGRVEEGSGSRTLGKQLFSQKCGFCHALADAGTRGTTGPNLDEAFKYARDPALNKQGFKESTIRDVVRGQIAYPVVNPVTGAAGMPGIEETLPECEGEEEPKGCVEDQDEAADAIAVYVAAVAGVPVQRGQDGGGKVQETDGKAIYTAAGCGGCHIFGPAGSTGTAGPNLDQSKPSLEEATRQIANGGGGMPPFEDQLTEQQIEAVARFVVGGGSG